MNKLKLYHYSNADFKGKIEPKYFGINSYTVNSARLCGFKRSYFYIEPSKKEVFFNGVKFLYIAEVNINKLYNLNIDKLKLWANNSNEANLYNIFKILRKKGYIGIIGNNGLKIAGLFKAIKIKQKIPLTK